MIRLQGWKGQRVRPHLVGMENLTFSLGMGEDAEGSQQRLNMARPQLGIRESGFCEKVPDRWH